MRGNSLWMMSCCCWPSWPRRPPPQQRRPPAPAPTRSRPPAPPATGGAAYGVVFQPTVPGLVAQMRQRRRLRARPGARPGQAGHLGRQPDRRDALPPRRRPQLGFRPRLRLLGHRVVRDARRGSARHAARLVVVHALRRRGQGPVDHRLHEPRPRLRGHRRAAAGHERGGRPRRRLGPALAPRTCARRAATGRATPSA